VQTVIPLPDYRLAVTFVDGTAGVVDLAARIASPKGGVFQKLRDKNTFAQVYIHYGAVTWPVDIDLAPDAMYAHIKANGEWELG